MKLLKAIDGFIVNIGSEGYSPATVRLYRINTSIMAQYLGDREVESITTQDLRSFFYFLRNEQVQAFRYRNRVPCRGRQSTTTGRQCVASSSGMTVSFTSRDLILR